METTPNVNAESLAQKLKDKVQLDIATMMPGSQWKKLLQGHIDTFLNEHTEKDEWGHVRTRQPSLKAVVHEVLTEMTREKAREMLESEEWKGFWKDGEEMAGQRIEALIKEALPDILSAVLQREIQHILSEMRQNM